MDKEARAEDGQFTASLAGLLKLENGTKSRLFLNDRYPGVFGKQASRASTNFRQVASIVSE